MTLSSFNSLALIVLLCPLYWLIFLLRLISGRISQCIGLDTLYCLSVLSPHELIYTYCFNIYLYTNNSQTFISSIDSSLNFKLHISHPTLQFLPGPLKNIMIKPNLENFLFLPLSYQLGLLQTEEIFSL